MLVEVESGGPRGLLRLSGRSYWSIGRESTCDIVLGDSQVSSDHCVLAAKKGVWVVADLQSTNGTYVNGRQIRNTVSLPVRALISLGRSKLQLCNVRADARDIRAFPELTLDDLKSYALDRRNGVRTDDKLFYDTAVNMPPATHGIDRVRAAFIGLGLTMDEPFAGLQAASVWASIADEVNLEPHTVRRLLGALQAQHGLAETRAPKSYGPLFKALVSPR